jgi:YD repeat-containing protein
LHPCHYRLGPAQQFTVTAPNGTVSTFFGFDSFLTTPGQLQTIRDRHGNTLALTWTSAGGVPQLQSVTDGFGRAGR